jgi:hypothetical protein
MRLHDAFYRELPGEQQLFDYGVRTDGQAVYAGHAPIAHPTSSSEWIISFFKFSGDLVSEIYCLKGSWDGRVALFVDYA